VKEIRQTRTCERDKTDSHNGRETERREKDERKKEGVNSGKVKRRSIKGRVVELRERCRRGAAGISVAHTHTHTYIHTQIWVPCIFVIVSIPCFRYCISERQIWRILVAL